MPVWEGKIQIIATQLREEAIIENNNMIRLMSNMNINKEQDKQMTNFITIGKDKMPREEILNKIIDSISNRIINIKGRKRKLGDKMMDKWMMLWEIF